MSSCTSWQILLNLKMKTDLHLKISAIVDTLSCFNLFGSYYKFLLLKVDLLWILFSYRCDDVDLVVEMDRILRPGGWVIIRDSIEMIQKLVPVVRSLHWVSTVHEEKYLVSRKAFWRPLNGGSSLGGV